jgi:hypothetical protein
LITKSIIVIMILSLVGIIVIVQLILNNKVSLEVTVIDNTAKLFLNVVFPFNLCLLIVAREICS